MKFGLVVPNRGPGAVENIRTVPPIAEALGFDSVWVTDHVIGVRSFQPVYGSEWLEALTSLAYLASSTSTIRLGIGVMVAPYRDPVMAAKIIATIDVLSDGRVDVGVGAGWSRSEFHALGAGERFETRGKFTDEALDVMLRCWEGGEFGWSGEFVEFRRMEFAPTPTQRPHPPVWVGGNTAPALRRTARVGDVWHPTNLTPDELRSKGDELDATAGRTIPRAVRLRVDPDGDLGAFAELVSAYAEAGCGRLIIEVDRDDGGIVRDWAEAFSRHPVASLQ
jgi:probable F420-dependent oxidoreductase